MRFTWRQTWPDVEDDLTCLIKDQSIGRVFFGHSRQWHWFLNSEPDLIRQAESLEEAKSRLQAEFAERRRK